MKSRVSNICWWKATYQNSGGNFQELDRTAALVPGKPELALCHTFPLRVWRPYCQVIPRVRRWHKLQEIVLNSLFFVMIRKTVFTCKIGRLIQWVFYCSSMTWRWPTPERSKVSFLKKKKKKKYIYIYIYLKFNLLDINFFSRGVYFLYTEIARKKTD